MTGPLELGRDGGDGHDADARCMHCGAPAAGPCARCNGPTCGDCSVLTDGGVRTYAICRGCERRGGRSLSPGWLAVVGWLMWPLAALLFAVIVLAWITSR